MIYVICSLILGIALGFTVTNQRLRAICNKASSPITFALLLILGIRLGSDQAAWRNFSSIGLSAIAITIFTVGGSIIAGCFYYLLRKGKPS